jgi:hypothetical protein
VDYTPHVRAVGWSILLIIILSAFFSWLSLGCASTGQLIGAGCVTTLCGEVCCPNDGKVCPVCWKFEADEKTGTMEPLPKEEKPVLETSPGSFDSMPGIVMPHDNPFFDKPSFTFSDEVNRGCYWVPGEEMKCTEGCRYNGCNVCCDLPSGGVDCTLIHCE